VGQLRFTSLDRIIRRSRTPTASGGNSSFFSVVVTDPETRGIRHGSRLRNQHVVERLIALQRMGLAEVAKPNEWRGPPGFRDHTPRNATSRRSPADPRRSWRVDVRRAATF
jgi:hypothetical protein